ncbi:hypothetical protein [Pyxidicoccus trucidator]|uniref:hypothetical protein n=1 Tax=Pyxidicoccus trucidator TaxID=2709662 RepID=UPI0013DD6218|nr:hypothetical protein [Pyxidicoccus trucidator]
MLAPCMLLMAACSGTPDRGLTAGYRLDSATQGCRQRPDVCVRGAGEEALLPTLRPAEAVASAVRTGAVVLRVLEATTRAVLERELKACAEHARSQVLVDHLGGRSPTRKECNEEVDDAKSGRRITLAMQLGCVMHEVALACVREALDEQIPGRFSLEQRYRFDPKSGALKLVSNEDVRSLLRMGCSDELTGTLVPDVVIHSGDPLEAEAIYDFKFPCMTIDATDWRQYPLGHPYAGNSQKQVYENALGAEALRVLPRWGILP